MVVLNKIYTRSGDAGTTALGSGARVAKDSPRIAAYGTVDETNAILGMARNLLGEGQGATDARLAHIQNDLFDLGADLCVPHSDETPDQEPLRINPAQVKWLEDEIDAMNANMEPLRSFVLPGGAPASSALHMARTVCRRAERKMVALAGLPGEQVSESALKYVNRLSDFLFVAARHVNDAGKADVLWVPGQNR